MGHYASEMDDPDPIVKGTHGLDLGKMEALVRNGKRLPLLSALALIAAAKRKEESDSLAVKVLQDAANAGAERDFALRERNAANARIAELERVLAGILPLCINPRDGGEFEDCEVAAVDAARAAIAETKAPR